MTASNGITTNQTTGNEDSGTIEDIEILRADDGSDTGQDGGGTNKSNPNPCHSADGYSGDVWDSTVSYAMDDVVEYPMGSFQFYIAIVNVSPGIAPDSAGATGRWVACDCEDLAIPWDPSVGQVVGYDIYVVVEYPVGSGQYFISAVNGNSQIPSGINTLEMWIPCGGDKCQESGGFGGPWYDQSISFGSGYMTDDIVEYPAGSGMFYISTSDGNTQHPMTLSNWEKCTCSDLYDGTSVATLYSPGNPMTINGASPTAADENRIVDVNGVLHIFSMGGGSEPALRPCGTDNCKPALEGWNSFSAAGGFYDIGVIVSTQNANGFWNILWVSQIENNGVQPPGLNGEWERCWPRHIAVNPVKGDGNTPIIGPKTVSNEQFYMVEEGDVFAANVFDIGDGKLVLSVTESSTDEKIMSYTGKTGPDDETGCWVQVIDPEDGSITAFWEDPCRVQSSVEDSGNVADDNSTMARAAGGGCWVISTYNGQTVLGEDGKPAKEWIDPCPYTRASQIDPNFSEYGCWINATTWASGECESYQLMEVDNLPPIVVSTCAWSLGAELEITDLTGSRDDVSHMWVMCGARIAGPMFEKSQTGTGISSDDVLEGVAGPEDETGCWVQVIDSSDGSISAFWEDPCRVQSSVEDSGNVADDNSTMARSIGASSGKVETGCWVISTYNGQTVLGGDGKPAKEWIDPCPYGNSVSNDFILPDGTELTVFYMLGKTCADFDLVDGATCEDAIVSVEEDDDGECDDDCPEVISGDADGDGVPNEWDDCPETTEGAATDTNGCEVDLKEIAEDSGLPGFTAITTLVAISMAVAVLRGRRQLAEL